jgi:hypothetical protein
MSQWLGHTKRFAHSPNHLRPFDDSFRPTQKIFDRIRPFSSWAGNNKTLAYYNAFFNYIFMY